VAIIGVCHGFGFPQNLPTSFSVDGSVRGEFFSTHQYNELVSGGITARIVSGWMQKPSKVPGYAFSIGLQVQGEVLLGFSDYGNGLLPVTNPRGVADFTNSSVRGTSWDETKCAFGLFQDAQLPHGFVDYNNWFFWNVWEQKAQYFGVEVIRNQSCVGWIVRGKQFSNFMVLYLNNKNEPVEVRVAYGSAYNDFGYVLHVFLNKFSNSSVHENKPSACGNYPSGEEQNNLFQQELAKTQKRKAMEKVDRPEDESSMHKSPLHRLNAFHKTVADMHKFMTDFYDAFE